MPNYQIPQENLHQPVQEKWVGPPWFGILAGLTRGGLSLGLLPGIVDCIVFYLLCSSERFNNNNKKLHIFIMVRTKPSKK